MEIAGKIWVACRRVMNGLGRIALKPLFATCGRNVRFNAFSQFTYQQISIGDDVYIGKGAFFSASQSGIIIRNKVMFGPNVTIMGGDHNTSELGRFMIDVHLKRPTDDQEVVIEDDVWVGCNATILKGVTIGRGSIVAAGAVVNRSCPPYSIIGGVPARVLRFRWSINEIIGHEKNLYPESDRLKLGELVKIRELAGI